MKNSEVLTLNGVPVRVDYFGEFSPSEVKIAPEKKPKELILVIPGNPGVTTFYHDFIERLHEKTKKPVWILSHGGHTTNIKDSPPLEKNLHLYNLKSQTEQKKEFIEQYLKNVKLYLIGHSIGCKMILEALQNVDNQVIIEKCYFLFPALERLAETPNGKILIFVYKYLMWLLLLGTFIMEILPHFFKVILLKIYFGITSKPYKNIPATLETIHIDVVKQCFFLADDEMKVVRELNHEAVSKLGDKLILYYGIADGWAPLSYYEDLKKEHTTIDARVCSMGIEHAFVMKHSLLMADLVSDWMM